MPAAGRPTPARKAQPGSTEAGAGPPRSQRSRARASAGAVGDRGARALAGVAALARRGGPGARRRPPGGGDEPRLSVRWLRLLALLVPIGLLAGVSLVFGMMMAVARELPDLETAEEFRTAQNSVLQDRSGETLGILTGRQARVIVPWSDISPSMRDAAVAVEDERFYTNAGVDVRGIGRALWQDVVARRAAQGGSTITQQFVKQATEAQDQRTVLNKMREAALAYHLTRKWSKRKILTSYLNTVYYGNGAYGIESAARAYFGKTAAHQGCGTPSRPCARELDPAESALLAGLIQSPSGFDPVAEPRRTLARRNVVLRKMREQGRLDADAYRQARDTPLPGDIEPPTLDSKNPYFASWISGQLVDRYGAQRTYEGGLKVRTTLDMSVQRIAEQAISQNLASPDGPQASLVAIDNTTGEVRAMVGGRDYASAPFNLATQGQRQPGSTFKPFVFAQALREGISPTSTWESKKRTFRVEDSSGRRERFTVNNYEDAYAGRTTLARALTFSDNSVFAQVGLKAGPKRISRLIERMGVRSEVSSNPAVVLGAPRTGVTVLDMAHAYESFATRGLRVSGTLGSSDDGPVGLRSVEQADGRVRRNRTRRDRVVSREVADRTTQGMLSVVRQGSGTSADYGGFAAGKTGTTENYGDAWFVGFSKRMTVAVWVGYPSGTRSMDTEFRGEPVAGGTYPALIWRSFMGPAEDLLRQRAEADARERGADDSDVEPTGDDVPRDPEGDDGTAAPGTDGGAADGTGTATTPQVAAPTTAAPATGDGTGGDGAAGTGDDAAAPDASAAPTPGQEPEAGADAAGGGAEATGGATPP